MTAGRAATALVAAATSALLVAGAAVGAPSPSGVRLAEAPVSHFPDMAFSVTLPRDQSLQASQVRVTENGTPVRDITVTKPGAENVGTVLVIDASESMAGRPIREAMAAARAFAQRRNPGQQLAVVTFNDKVSVPLPLTSDSASIGKAIASVPALATGTHIYDALRQASALFRDSGITNGSIVLLSDGKDVGSILNQEDAIEAVNEAKARVFAVGLRSRQYEPDALRTIVAQTSGSYSEASSAAALRQIYGELGYTLSHEYLLRYRSLAGPSAKMVVSVRVDGVAGTARTSYTTPALVTLAPPTGPSLSDRIVRSSITLFVVILIVASLLAYGVFRVVYRPERAVSRRIGQFVTLPAEPKGQQREGDIVSVAQAEAASAASSSSWLQRFEDDVALAGITASMGTVTLVTAIGGLVLGVVVSAVIGSPAGLLVLLVAPFIAQALVRSRINRLRKMFADQLPENLDVISAGLRSGHSFVGALAVCVEDAAEPTRSELRRVISDEQLGVPIEESLHVAGERMLNRDLVQVALVAKLQREAGTNAAEVLDQVAENVRAQLELRRLIAGLTAQGRMARWIVSLLPVVLFLALFILNRAYLEPLWTELAGIVGMIVGATLLVLGSLIIKRIVNIRV